MVRQNRREEMEGKTYFRASSLEGNSYLLRRGRTFRREVQFLAFPEGFRSLWTVKVQQNDYSADNTYT